MAIYIPRFGNKGINSPEAHHFLTCLRIRYAEIFNIVASPHRTWALKNIGGGEENRRKSRLRVVFFRINNIFLSFFRIRHRNNLSQMYELVCT